MQVEPMTPTPVYYVVSIVEQPVPPYYYRAVEHIVAVIAYDLADIETLYQNIANPLVQTGQPVNTRIYRREPANPFREQAKPAGWLPGDKE